MVATALSGGTARMRFGSCAPISSEVFLQSDATLRSNDTCIA